MRRDFDFVDMGDYQRDMAESSDQATHIIKEMRKERDFWKAAFVASVKKAGGAVRIPLEHELQRAPDLLGLEMSYYQDDMTTGFRIVS